MEIKISHHKNSVDLIIKYTASTLLASNFLCVEYVEEMHSKSQATEITHLPSLGKPNCLSFDALRLIKKMSQEE